MLSVYRTLSVRYLARRWFRAVLIVASIALGVSTLVATRALNGTMTKAGLATVNPLAGVADLVVSNGPDTPVSRELAKRIREVPGVKAANPRIFRNIKLPEHDDRSVGVIGLDVLKEIGDEHAPSITDVTISTQTIVNYTKEYGKYLLGFSSAMPVVLGKELDSALPEGATIIKAGRDKKNLFELIRVGTVEGRGTAVVLGGNVLILDLAHAAKVVGLKDDQANRIDVVLTPGSNLEAVRKAVTEAVNGQGEVRTPQEQDVAMGNVMSGMQTGFALCGLAALVVGLFLVYNALAVCVAERRHEIGVLLSLGATRRQVQLLFGGEAILLGLAGSLLGIPLGIALANFSLQPVQRVLSEIFMRIDARQVEVSGDLVLLALVAGTLTALVAALVPAILASNENPAEAVRRVEKPPGWRQFAVQVASSALLLLSGIILIVLRKDLDLPQRTGIYGGMVLVLLGALVATPLLTALGARLIQPLVRRIFPLEWRLAADNLVRAPGRTGLVIAALAAGVALVVQTAGTIVSNRYALREWAQETLSADLVLTPGSPVGPGDQTMSPDLPRDVEALPEIEACLGTRTFNVLFGGTQIRLNAIDAERLVPIDAKRRPHAVDLPIMRHLSRQTNAAVVSENFTALHGLGPGGTLTFRTPKGEVTFTIIGKIVDYSWNHGSVFINHRDYVAAWGDPELTWCDVYIKPGYDAGLVQEKLSRKFGAQHGIWVTSQEKLQKDIDDVIERLYGIAYAQQLVVMFVAALGVVTALLISVLQRRREMGLLRAIGASRIQVVRSVLAEAALMGIFGTVIGVLVGIPLQWYVLKVLILEESGYLFPLYVPWLGALIIALAAMTTATLAGLGPAIYAVRQRIPEAIAYE